MTSSTTNQVATPTAYPAPGTFDTTQRVTLLCDTPGAAIHYTTDASAPNPASPIFDPYTLPVLEAINEGDQGIQTEYTIRAIAVKDGLADSAIATFNYTIDRRSKDVYISREVAPGMRMVLDFDDTKMMLIIGSQRALFVDAGLGTGDLRGYVLSLIGDLPLDVVITHAHPDHVALMGQFQGHHNVYMHHADLPLCQRFIENMHYDIDLTQIIDLREGFVFDLGNRQFKVYEVPGHTPGSIVLFDEQAGILVAGDALGSNRPTIVDALWMQHKGMAPIDEYLSTLQVFRPKLHGKLKQLYTGHNDTALYGETYLDNLQQAAQNLVDHGDAALVPSLRPVGVWSVVVGDRMTDPDWIAINVSKGAYLTASPDKLATLSNLQVSGTALDAPFKPSMKNYIALVAADADEVSITPVATSSCCDRLAINGVPVRSGAAHTVKYLSDEKTFEIAVTSPDGKVVNSYMLIVKRAA